MILIQTLMFTKAGNTKLKTATNVLNELYKIKKNKRLPFLTIRRAIKIQKKLIKNI